MPGVLTASRSSISTAVGEVVAYDMDFPDTFAGHSYLVLGSATGTAGFVYQGVSVPLTMDALTVTTATGPMPPMLYYFQGTLDAAGTATAYLATRPGELAAHAGTTVYWAAVSVDPNTGFLSDATNAVALDLLP